MSGTNFDDHRLPKVIELGPSDEAARLWRGALDAYASADERLVALCETLQLGIRSAEILAVGLMQSVRSEFPGTIALQLETPAPEVDVLRDAVATPNSISFTEILDLMGDEDLSCVGPHLHRGWEDRRFSCARSRATTKSAIGFSLDAASRDKLLLLTAYRNRIFYYPPPLRIAAHEILDAYPALIELVEKLQAS